MTHLNTSAWPEFLQSASAFIAEKAVRARPPLVPEIELYLCSDITPLWQAFEAELQAKAAPAPFWSYAWAGGQALSRYILDHPELVKGKRVFDFASGSGLVALAAKRAGAAAVSANDIDPFAIVAIGMNAQLNGLDLLLVHEDKVGAPLEDADVILAGDFCYEWPMAGYATEWLRGLAAHKEVFIADPGRMHAPKDGLEKLAEFDVPADLSVEESTVKRTGVFRLLAEE
jgi:predicted nicotinamide N-methyase